MKKSELKRITVGECRDLIVANCTRILKGSRIIDAVDALLEDDRTHTLYVVDAEDKLAGAISVMKLIEVATVQVGSVTGRSELAHVSRIKKWRLKHVEVVDDVMKRTWPLRDDQALTEALDIMEKHNRYDLPVVDGEGTLIGELNGLEVLTRLSNSKFFKEN